MAERPGDRPGQFRVGVSQGLTRNLTDDFAHAEPTDEEGTQGNWMWLTELSLHYGLVRDLDIGVRLRPTSIGGKLEALRA